MYRYPGLSCIVAFTALLGGCRLEYEVRPDVMQRTLLTLGGTDVAVQVHPYNINQPPVYVDYAALRVEKERSQAPWLLSTRNRGSYFAGGSFLVALGLAGIVGGSYIFSLPPCVGCNGDQQTGQGIARTVIGVPSLAIGILAIIPAVILFIKGIPRVTVRVGRPDVMYVPEQPVVQDIGSSS